VLLEENDAGLSYQATEAAVRVCAETNSAFDARC